MHHVWGNFISDFAETRWGGFIFIMLCCQFDQIDSFSFACTLNYFRVSPHWELNLWGDCLSAPSSFGSGVREQVNRRLPDVFLQQCGCCSSLLWWVSHSVYVPTLTYSHELWGVPVNSSGNELPTTQTQPINSRGRKDEWMDCLFFLIKFESQPYLY